MNKVKLWGRFGANLEITRDELEQFKNSEDAGELLKQWFSEGKIRLCGETYFPPNDDDDYECLDTDGDFEVNV